MLRRNLPFLKGTVYLDSASVSPAPSFVLRKMDLYHREFPFNYGVGVFKKSERCRSEVDKARRAVAQFIGAYPEEVIFTKNTTEAINLVSSGLTWNPGDEVIVTELEHQSNLIPWFRLKREKGVKVKVVKLNREGFIDPGSIVRALSRKTRLVAMTHVSNLLGTVQNVEEVGHLVQGSRVLFMVDGAQSVGRIPVNFGNIRCDFFAGCGRKALMGPQGTAFLFGKRDRLKKLRPLMLGSRGANVIPPLKYGLEPIPFRFESGVLNTSGFVGLGSAAEYLKQVGLQKIAGRIRELTSVLLGGLKEIEGIKIYGSQSTDGQAGILSWNLEGYDCHEVARALDKKGILVASGVQGSPLAMKGLGAKGVVRTSLHYYNTEKEIDRLLKGMTLLMSNRGSKGLRQRS